MGNSDEVDARKILIDTGVSEAITAAWTKEKQWRGLFSKNTQISIHMKLPDHIIKRTLTTTADDVIGEAFEFAVDGEKMEG